MKRASLAILALMAVGGVARADVFDKPPEINAPAWGTPFPYQRNINLGFGVNPVAAPGSGIPGAVYEGWYDFVLKATDQVTFDGSVQWYDNVAGITPTGLIGIDNRGGTATLTGTAIFHVDNVPWDGPLKHLWYEADWIENPPPSDIYITVEGPPSYSAASLGGLPPRDLGNGFFRDNYEWEIIPNPHLPTPWELVKVNFAADPGEYVLLDALHLATECIPEPQQVAAGWVVVLLSAVGYGLRRHRRQRVG
jgi:hypothetical protein